MEQLQMLFKYLQVLNSFILESPICFKTIQEFFVGGTFNPNNPLSKIDHMFFEFLKGIISR